MTNSSVNIECHAGVVPADRLGQISHDALLLFGRIIMALIFVQSGFGKLLDIGAFSASLAGKGVPFASAFGVIGACVEFFGGLAVLAVGKPVTPRP